MHASIHRSLNLQCLLHRVHLLTRPLVGQGLCSSFHSPRVVSQALLQLGLAGGLAFAALPVGLEGVLAHLRHQQLLRRLAQVDRLLLPPPARPGCYCWQGAWQRVAWHNRSWLGRDGGGVGPRTWNETWCAAESETPLMGGGRVKKAPKQGAEIRPLQCPGLVCTSSVEEWLQWGRVRGQHISNVLHVLVFFWCRISAPSWP